MELLWINVKKLINKDIEHFEAKDDLERVCLLRDFAFRHIPFALSPSTHLIYENVCGETNDAKERVGRLFATETICSGGFYCGGCAHALMELYRALGYESRILDIGKDLGDSHCVTLVRLPQHGEWYVQDSTFNQTIYDKQSGGVMSLNKMLSLLTKRKHDEIVVREGGTTIRIGIADDDVRCEYYPYIKKLQEQNGHKLFLIDMNRKYYRPDANMEAALQRKGYPGKIIYAFLFPFDEIIYESCGITLRKA